MNRNAQTGGRIVYSPVPAGNRPESATCSRLPEGCNPARCLLMLVRRRIGRLISALSRLWAGLGRTCSGWDRNLLIAATAVLLLIIELILAISETRR